MKNKTIDILMATYNGEKYVAEQIESILNQTYKNIRLVISDDCSTDGTRDVLKKYEKNERVEIHLQEKNLGYIRNFEYLLKQVKNELYMLSDQDDFWLEEKVEKTVEVLEKENADMVFGDLEIVDENLKTIYPSFGDFMLLNRKIKKKINSYELNYLYNCVTGCTLLSKKKYLDKILPIPYESKYVVHDHWIALMVSVLNGKMVYIPEKYIKYRQHGNNQIGTDKISHKFTKLKQVRKLFIEVKLGVFGTYVKNNNRFPNKIQELNKKAYEYYKMLEKKKYFNFKGWGIFHKLYKNETIVYYMENFCIMNLPFIGNVLFKIRHMILKLLGKR